MKENYYSFFCLFAGIFAGHGIKQLHCGGYHIALTRQNFGSYTVCIIYHNEQPWDIPMQKEKRKAQIKFKLNLNTGKR